MATWPTVIDDSGTREDGTVVDKAWSDQVKAYIDAAAVTAAPIAWTDIAFNAANYGAATGAWTVTAANQEVLAYCQIAKTVFVTISIVGASTVSASTAALKLILPAPVPLPIRNVRMAMTYLLPGVGGNGQIEMISGARNVWFNRDMAATPWPAQTATGLFLMGGFFYPVA
jgi:hypothetical protein